MSALIRDRRIRLSLSLLTRKSSSSSSPFSFSAEVTVYPGFNGSRFNQRRRGRKKFKGVESLFSLLSRRIIAR